MAINLNMLRYVNTIAKTGSFSEAAKQLYVSQPYLSQCVKSFENEVGVKIFDRTTHPIKVTPAGMCFVEWGRSIEDNEKAVLKWRDYNDLTFIQCACRFVDEYSSSEDGIGKSKRQEVKKLIDELKKTNPDIEHNIFKSIHNVKLDTFISYKEHGVVHNFLDDF